ncbi:MAG: hypothetical protein IKO52_05560 [Clostridia bacterium]|nr:hypothetical protein [Clostridia bacterium]
MDDEIKIRLSDIIFALQKHWKLILATSIAGTMFGLVLTAMSYVKSSLVTYNINGSFAVSTMNEAGNFTTNGTAANKDDYYLSENMVAAIRYVLNSRQVVESAIEDEKLLGVEASDIQHNVSISQYGETQIVEMTLTWRSPEEGIDIWNAIIDAGNRVIPKVLQLGTLVIINEPKASQVGISRAGPKLAIMLSGLGFMAGVGFAVVSMLLHPTLNNLKDVDAVLGLETLGMIPQSLTWSEQNGKILERHNSEVIESFSAATYILRNRLGSREKHRCFYITSTTSKEGKSAVAANIAIQLSGMECHTLLVDFDTRNPDIGTMFLPDVDYTSSLNALYRGEANEYDVITHINGYLDLMLMIPEHNPIPLDGTIEDLFAGLVSKYDYMVINASPVGMVSETLSLNQITNNVLFVVGYDSAPMSEIQASLQKMDKSGARVIGCIVNGVKGKLQNESGIQLPFMKNNDRKPRQEMREDVHSDGGDANLVDEILNMTEKSQEKPQEKQPEKTQKKLQKKAREKQPEKQEENQPETQKSSPLKQLFGKKKREQKTDEPAPVVVEMSEPPVSRNIMEDLILDEPGKDEVSDSDTVSEMLRIESKKSSDDPAKDEA